MSARVLVVEDDPVALELLTEVLAGDRHDVRPVASAESALVQAQEFRPEVVVTDLRLAEMDGLALLRAVKALDPATQVIVVTAFGSLEAAVEAIREGAFDYMSKPFRMDEMRAAVRRAIDAYSAATQHPDEEGEAHGRLIGRSQAMTAVFTAIARVASLKTSVLIQGETGTGKELIARAIHDAGDRAAAGYVTVNCASLPEGLLESELFGHIKGAFTGAQADRKGLFEAADKGTVLLDEIGDMPLAVQAKLLRVLESGEVRPVGATTARTVDVRVLAATHRELQRAVEDGSFRQDLFFRLNAVTIVVPPLRERPEDLSLLTEHFLNRHARDTGRAVRGLSDEAQRVFKRYAWPGNVRELSHVIERAVVLTRGAMIEADDLPAHMRAPQAVVPNAQTLEEVERAHVLAVLKSVKGNRVRAAAILGIDRKTLYRKLLRYGLSEEEPGAS